MITTKYRSNILFAAYLSPITILLPKLFISGWSDSLLLGATILCAIAAAAAIIIVVKFYQDFVANKILDKNIETIGNFLEEMNSISLDISCIDLSKETENEQTIFWIRVRMKKGLNLYQLFFDNKLDPSKIPIVFEINNYYDGLGNLYKIADSIFMPKELQASFGPIRLPVFSGTDLTNLNPHVNILFNRKRSQIYDNLRWKSDAYVNSKDFFDAFQKVISDLESWISQNCDSDVVSRLNL
jgi:hypothetical protein